MECTHMSTFPALLLLHEKNASSAAWHCFVNESSSYKPVPLSLCSAPDERLVLEDASQLAHLNEDSPTHSDLGATSQLLASLQSERRAVQMLHDRISLAYEYVIGVQNGTHPYDAAILSHISSSVVHRGPLSDNSKDHAASVPCLLQQKSSDAMFSSYLAALTNNLHALNEVRFFFCFCSNHYPNISDVGAARFCIFRHIASDGPAPLASSCMAKHVSICVYMYTPDIGGHRHVDTTCAARVVTTIILVAGIDIAPRKPHSQSLSLPSSSGARQRHFLFISKNTKKILASTKQASPMICKP